MERADGIRRAHAPSVVRFAAAAATAACLAVTAGCTASPPPEPEAVTATLVIHDGEADVTHPDGGGDAQGDAVTLAQGDVVSVEGEGALVELAWSDGAVTRLGAGTEFEIGDPAATLGTRGRQSGGVTWNRIADDAREPYDLRVGDSETVTERGPLFVVDCRVAPCRVSGTGGSGGDGSKVSFRVGDVVTAVDGHRLATWRELMPDEWAERNAQLDVDAGFTAVGELFADADPSRGELDGTFDVVRTGVTSECSGAACDDLVLLKPGEVRQLEFTFHSVCATGQACTASVDTQSISISDGSLLDATTGLVFGAGTFSWGRSETRPICIWTYDDGTTTEVGHAVNDLEWTVTPTRAEMRDGRFVVTELRGSTQSSMTVIEPVSAGFPGCEQFQADWSGNSDMVLTRRDS